MVFRVEKNKNYTTMSNYHLRDKNLSLKAKGLLSWMLANTDDWDYSIRGMESCLKENAGAISSALDELKECGYLVVNKLMPESVIDEQGNRKVIRSQIVYEYCIFEQPQNQEGGFLGVENQALENLGLEVQGLEVQALENPTQINTNRIITKKEILNKEKPKEENSQKCDYIVKQYHEYCYNLPKVRALTDKRKKAIQNILKKHSQEELIECFKVANESAFLMGENDRGWRADLDFLLREDKFVNILEGKYGGRKKSKDGVSLSPRADKKEDIKIYEKF